MSFTNNNDNPANVLALIESDAIATHFKPVLDAIAPHLHDAKVEVSEEGEGVDAFHLADIYEGRHHHLKKIGTEYGGLLESTRALRAEGGRVRIVAITTTKYHILCFVTMALDRLVGLVYVAHSETREY